MTFGFRHLLLALVLHAALFAVLLGGLQCSRKPERPPVIQAVLLDPDRKETAAQKRELERKRAEEKRRQEAERKRREEEARRRLEEEQKKREAEDEKRKLAEQQRKLEAEKKKQLEEQQRQQKELAEKKKAEDEARRAKEAQELRERQEQAQRELQERARLEEAMREEAMRRELEREGEARAASERERKQAEWVAVLQRHVQKNWIRTTGPDEFECEVQVTLLPDGSVTSARIVRSCGSPALNKSVEDAVYRSSPLPKPADPAIFDRDLIITFVPK